jgi:hypothetical protein
MSALLFVVPIEQETKVVNANSLKENFNIICLALISIMMCLKVAHNVRGLPQGWNCCCVSPATEADRNY